MFFLFYVVCISLCRGRECFKTLYPLHIMLLKLIKSSIIKKGNGSAILHDMSRTISNEKLDNYRILGLVELYNFDTKFVFIRVLMKKL
jgi:hypothetical protein